MKSAFAEALLESGVLKMFPHYLTDSYEWQGHIPFAFWLAKTFQPSVFVELGAYKGDSYMAFCQAFNQSKIKCQCHAVDTWSGDAHVGAYGDEIYDNLRAYHDARYASFSRLHRMLFEDAVDSFSDGSIDLLHIDGLHTYDAVKHDYETWLPKMSGRGVMIFHDTAVKERGFGVWKLMEELKLLYPSFFFKHSNGLGVLLVGQAIEDKLVNIAEMDNSDYEIFHDFFQFAGDRVQSHVQSNFWHKRCDQLQYECDQLQDKANFVIEIEKLAGQINSKVDALAQEQTATRQVISGELAQKVDVITGNISSSREFMDSLGKKVDSLIENESSSREFMDSLGKKVDGLIENESSSREFMDSLGKKVDGLTIDQSATREVIANSMQGIVSELVKLNGYDDQNPSEDEHAKE